MNEVELLEALRKEADSLYDELSKKNRMIRELSEKLFLESKGVSIGDKIQWTYGGKEWTGEICGVEYDRVIAQSFKKDGSLSSVKKTVYNFMNFKKAENE